MVPPQDDTAVRPTVSVIIPTYNRANYIAAAIDSVLAQTYTDYEIIVVDDGSTDDTEARVRAFGNRVEYIWTENGGTGHARNVGMRAARGRYLTFLDSDDLLYPYALEVETRILDRHPEVGFVVAESSGFDDDGFFERYHLRTYHESAYRQVSDYREIWPKSEPLADVLPAEMLSEDPSLASRRLYSGHVFDCYLINIILFQNTAMMRREAAEATGLRNETVRLWEERDYLLRMSRRHQVAFADVPTYKLRYHGGQVSTLASADGKFRWARKQQGMLHIFRRHALADPVYYEQHRAAIDKQMAHLHRAIAVPLLLFDGEAARSTRYASYARVYLDRCARYGHGHPALVACSYLPGALRRTAVTVLEKLR